ncbi:hypothetical protein LV89_02914 [Arcicella aurantiaca]|uniref:Uncharacterized protein n=1 Tax=Arcicella aurantiaca TaxID=591202 RepID=A0A316E1Z7_9BACT|nr:hypothetical protein [Arcicella aurantiaca]PWK24401.1 hypothetical protein LV89_02914 [Arcicella aurantiaca]
MIKASKKVVTPMISEKLNSSLRLQVCSAEEVDFLITELNPDHELLSAFHHKVKHIL